MKKQKVRTFDNTYVGCNAPKQLYSAITATESILSEYNNRMKIINLPIALLFVLGLGIITSFIKDAVL